MTRARGRVNFGSMAKLDPTAARKWAWEAALFALVTLMLSYTWMYGDISVPNERSRVYLAVALVEHDTVQIDEQIRLWGKIYDLAERDDHFYSDKAPGSSMLGAVVYVVAKLFQPDKGWRIRDLINLMRSWLMIPLTLIGFFFLRRILEYLGLDPPVVDITSLGWVLGTAAFHYGAAYFGHQIVAVALIAALYCVLRAEESLSQPKSIAAWCLGAGTAAGVAGLTEYQAAIPCVLLVLYVFGGDSRIRTHGTPALLLGAAPFAFALLWYNNLAFGGPFELSYHYLADKGLQEIHGQGIAGVTVPTWEYFSGSMFSLHRGLFATSPLFLFALWGLWTMWDEGDRRLAGFIGVTLLFFVAFVSSSNMWFAGWGFGPRLLVPGMALWSVAVGVGVQSAFHSPITEGFARGLCALQIAYIQLVNVYFPEPPESTQNPMLDVVPLMREHELVSPNLGQKFGLDPLDSVTLLGVLALIAIAIVLVRGTRPLNWSARGIIAGAVVACFLIGATGVYAKGETWDDKKRAKWVKLCERWEARENPGE